MDTSNLVLVVSAGGVGRSVLEHLRAQDMPVRGVVHPTFRSLSHRVCRGSRNTVPVGRPPAHARAPEQPNRVGVVRVGLQHDHAYVFKTLEEPAQRRVIGRLFDTVSALVVVVCQSAKALEFSTCAASITTTDAKLI